MTPQQFAAVILLAAQLHEASYNKNGDYTYAVDYHQATQLACVQHRVELLWADIIYLLLAESWNEAHDWANEHSA